MNRKLQIDIDQIEKDHQQVQEQQQQSQVGESQQEYSQNQNHYEHDQSSQLKMDSRKNRQQIHQNAQNLVHDKNHSILLQQFVNYTQHKNRRTEQLSKMLQTPVRSYDNQEEINTKNRLEQSSIDQEINRIINKVMSKKTAATVSNIPKHLNQFQQVSKIDAVNKQLLSENTKLIGQINQLQKQLYALNKKSVTKKKIKQSKNMTISNYQDTNSVDTITKYKQRLAKALNLNSKLSSRLNTEKSRSRIISSCYPSKVNRKDNASSSIQLTSLDSNLLKISKKQPYKKSSNVSENIGKVDRVYCEKCLNEIGTDVRNSPQVKGSKQIKQSPVLQFKNYKIECSKTLNCVQFELSHNQNQKKHRKDVQCQVSLDQTQYLQQLQAHTRQQIQLEQRIKDNNQKIIHLEESLYRLIDYP